MTFDKLADVVMFARLHVDELVRRIWTCKLSAPFKYRCNYSKRCLIGLTNQFSVTYYYLGNDTTKLCEAIRIPF